MRSSLVVVLLLTGIARADGPRFGIAVDPKTYPQATPKETLASVLKAVDAKRVDYLTAQLADPVFIDDRVKRLFGGHFEEQVTDTASRLDPVTVKLLGRFLKDGDWTTEKDTATVRLKDVKERAIYFRKIGERWYVEQRWKP